MKLHWSPRSPFVRKVAILLKETGLEQRVTKVRSVAAIAAPNPAIMADNPLSQIPALVRDDGQPLYDSAVICEYLDSLHEGAKFFPAFGDARWTALRRQALGDNMLSVLLIWRQERLKDPARQMPDWLTAFAFKIDASLDRIELEVDSLGGDFDIGQLTIGCMLSYLDYRFMDIDWRHSRPALAAWHATFLARPSVIATAPDDAQT